MARRQGSAGAIGLTAIGLTWAKLRETRRRTAPEANGHYATSRVRRESLAAPPRHRRAARRAGSCRRKPARCGRRLAGFCAQGAAPRRRPRQARPGAGVRHARRFSRRAPADPAGARRRQYPAAARGSGADRPRNFCRSAHRRQRATARITGCARRRRECRGDGQAGAHSDRARRADDAGKDLCRAGGQAVSGRSCRTPGALRRAAAGYRAPGRFGIAGDQSAGADQGRHAHRLRRQDRPRRGRRFPPRPGASSRSAGRWPSTP